jgi:hypothetical protein
MMAIEVRELGQLLLRPFSISAPHTKVGQILRPFSIKAPHTKVGQSQPRDALFT